MISNTEQQEEEEGVGQLPAGWRINIDWQLTAHEETTASSTQISMLKLMIVLALAC